MKEFEERSKRILEYVNSKEYKIMTAKQIAVVFGVPKEDMPEFEKIINKLEVNGKIYIDDSKRICLPNNVNKFVCKFEAKSKGFGFARVLSTDAEVEAIYIARECTNGAFDENIILATRNLDNVTSYEMYNSIIIKEQEEILPSFDDVEEIEFSLNGYAFKMKRQYIKIFLEVLKND